MKYHMKCSYPILLLTLICTLTHAQQPYFVDGYHGGIYGHYPVEWKTRYMTDLIRDYPQWKMCLEIEPETWDTVAVRTPEDYEYFRRIATNKRVEFTNPAYAQPYCYNISGESIIRQFDYGIRSIRNHFPGVEFVTYAVEEPCFTSSLPQILNQFGFKYAVLKCPNTCWGGYTAPYGGELVNWIGPDGSSILTVPRYACEELEKNSVWQTTAWGNEDGYLKACRDYNIEHPVGMTYQDAGWKRGPWIGIGDSIKNNSIYVTWREYFENISNGKTDDNYHMPQEDVRVSLMWGSQVLQRIARQVRQSENNLVIAEKIGVIANVTDGYRYDQKNLNEAWRTLMLAQHHDSWIVPYNRLHGQYTWADAIAGWTASTNTITGNIITKATGSLRTDDVRAGEKGIYLRVYNTLGIPRHEVICTALPENLTGTNLQVTNADGKKIQNTITTTGGKPTLLFKVEVPAFGYATYHVAPGKTKKENRNKPDSKSTEVVLENNMYRIVIDPLKGGTIKSLIAKKEGKKEFSDNNSTFSLGELRGFFYDEGVFHSSTEKPAEVVLIENNSFRKTVRIQGEIASHPFIQTIKITEGQRKIEFDLTIDWKHNVGIGEYHQKDAYGNNRRAFYDDRFKLNVLFPVALESPSLWKNAPFDVCRSQLENTHFKTWDGIKHNIILNWIDLADEKGQYGFSLLSDHTTSYSYGEDFPLGLTVQFSGNGLWGRDYLISGPTDIRFAIIPHSNQWDTANIHNESLQWNEPLVTSFMETAKPENTSLINVDGTGYEIVSSYLSDDGIILRIFNASGNDSPQDIKIGIPATKVEEVDLNGNVIGNIHIENGIKMRMAMPRFGIKTLKLTKPDSSQMTQRIHTISQ